jgi:hypothetical protein
MKEFMPGKIAIVRRVDEDVEEYQRKGATCQPKHSTVEL